MTIHHHHLHITSPTDTIVIVKTCAVFNNFLNTNVMHTWKPLSPPKAQRLHIYIHQHHCHHFCRHRPHNYLRKLWTLPLILARASAIWCYHSATQGAILLPLSESHPQHLHIHRKLVGCIVPESDLCSILRRIGILMII